MPIVKIIAKIIFLVLILGVFPAMSWYYLSGGLQWRKDALSEIKHDFGKIRQAWIVLPDGSKENLLEGKVCVVHNFGINPDLTDGNRKILDQVQLPFTRRCKQHARALTYYLSTTTAVHCCLRALASHNCVCLL